MVDGVEHGTAYLLTRRGTPVAVISPIDRDALEDFVLAHAQPFARDRELADEDLRTGRTTSLSDFMRSLDDEQ